MRRLAEVAGTTPSTISAMINGTRDTSSAIVQRVAEALRMGDRVAQVSEWVGLARTEVRPFQPHRDADLLTAEEQEAINEMIRLLAAPKKRGGGARGLSADPASTDDPPPMFLQLADRYTAQADGDLGEAIALLQHDGAAGAGVGENTWFAALTALRIRQERQVLDPPPIRLAPAARDTGRVGKARKAREEQDAAADGSQDREGDWGPA